MLAVAIKAERTSPVSVDLIKLHSQVSAQFDLDPIQVLKVVRERVAGQELHLSFDYNGLHFRGHKLLRTLHTHLHAQLSLANTLAQPTSKTNRSYHSSLGTSLRQCLVQSGSLKLSVCDTVEADF
ncbi:hypothetical protein Slin14017_G053320 [Septoria linicola]|nr:hypothetical protein Slin14017_G053320 [Septoria linicola]